MLAGFDILFINENIHFLFFPLFRILILMAINPVLVILHSPFLFIADVILRVSHILISLQEYYQIKHLIN
ncbi:hypothetical protein BBF96_08690 [Anoxybacter fermentans]|uniref:Uncharacterized protein n=1 Tax=Anoxybacter fermentans TaxID=1323375 RepID=A0A3S9SZ47_9FIRM|nr:hypothetical protein BBF96_08690 [Anoxybacter fermentans]